MKEQLIAGAALAALIGTPALAADMPLKAPPPPVTVYNWTGCYVGANTGYQWGDGNATLALQPWSQRGPPSTLLTELLTANMPTHLRVDSAVAKWGVIGSPMPS